MRQGSAPNFAPPIEEGMVLTFVTLEFLGLILHEDQRYGFFFPVDEETQTGASGEVLILEVTELDEDGQPCAFELLDDEGVAQDIYKEFKEATKDLYDFC